MTAAGQAAARDAFTVSVIIPTRDRPELLARALESVFGQTRPPEEIIVVDDASSGPLNSLISSFSSRGDGEPAPDGNLAQESGHNYHSYHGNGNGKPFADSDFSHRVTSDSHSPPGVEWVRVRGGSCSSPRLVLHRLERPSGGGIARNTGAALARGEILMFLDDDDAWLPEKAARQLAVFRDNPAAGLVYSGRRVIDEHGRLLFTVYPEAAGEVHRLLLQRNVIGVTSAVALRREVFHAAGGFDPDLPARQDYDLWIRAARLAPVAFDRAATVHWMVHSKPGRQLSSRPDNYRRAIKIIFAKYHPEFSALKPGERRRAYASQYVILAEKYAQAGRFLTQAASALRAFALCPSLAAVSRLLPYSLWLKLRRFLERRKD